MSAKIYLIRHGKTAANLENRFAGRTEEPLHQEGVEHLQEVAAGLSTAGLDRIYAGPLLRTRQSAEIIAKACHCPHSVLAGLNDIDLPHWDGLTKDEIRQRFGPEYPLWLSDPQGFQVAGCETLADVQARAVRDVELVGTENAGESVLLVTHLIVARCLILHYRNQPLANFRSVEVANGAMVPLVG